MLTLWELVHELSCSFQTHFLMYYVLDNFLFKSLIQTWSLWIMMCQYLWYSLRCVMCIRACRTQHGAHVVESYYTNSSYYGQLVKGHRILRNLFWPVILFKNICLNWRKKFYRSYPMITRIWGTFNCPSQGVDGGGWFGEWGSCNEKQLSDVIITLVCGFLGSAHFTVVQCHCYFLNFDKNNYSSLEFSNNLQIL